MKINLITKTFNEARLVPYFFRHYDQFVTNYYIWDNMSTDGTRELLSRNPKVTMFDLEDTEFDDYKHRDFKNNAWKEFKDCDWVINCDFDEFVYCHNLLDYLKSLKRNGINLIQCEGFQMFSESFPTLSDMFPTSQIYEIVNKGVQDHNYDKSIIFQPSINIEYSFGAHKCYEGLGVYHDYGGVKLLHYKVLGPDFITDILARNNRLSERNKSEGLSVWPEEKGHRFNPYEVYENLKNNAIPVI